jgi:cation diffusion facilitator family transporter
VAILASLADSGLDLLAALGTFWAVRFAATPPDSEHRYGHGKAEAFASLIQAGLVFASAALVGREAVTHLIRPQPVTHEAWDLGVMVISTVLTLALVQAQTQVLKSAQSVAVTSDRTHYLADIAANIAAFIGIGLSLALGDPIADALAGLLVAAWLVWGAIGVFRGAGVELMDQELGSEARERIITLMRVDPRVRDVHELRTRASGPYIHMQMHAEMDPDMTVAQAHTVMIEAERRVLEAFPMADIMIHPDPRGQAEAHGGPFAESDTASHQTAALSLR